MNGDASRIPVHVLSGFLGVGKTTAVRDLLARRAENERIAVIVNEFGDLGVDGALLSDCTTCILREVPGGCICCTAMADLEVSVDEIYDLVAPTRLVIEPTGLAKPSEIVDLFQRPRLATRFELRPVITLIDPTTDYRASYDAGGLFRDQIDLGDFLVITRADLATEDELRLAEEFANGLVPSRLGVLRSSMGVLPDSVFETPLPTGRGSQGDRGAGTIGLPSLLPSLSPNPTTNSGGRERVEGHEGRGFWRGPERLFETDRLDAFLEALAGSGLGLTGSVARAKGIFRTTTGWRVYEIAGGRLSRGSTEYRRDNRFDAILKDPSPADFEVLDRELEGALIPEGAPLIEVEDEGGFVRAFDLQAIAARFGAQRAVPLHRLVEAASTPSGASWLWLISESGRFAVGGPRAVLANGLVTFRGANDEIQPRREDEGGPFRYTLGDEEARGFEDEVDLCRDVPGLCGLRLAERPGAADRSSGGPAGVEVPDGGS